MTTIKLEPALEIDFHDNPGPVRFETLDEVEAFVGAEQTAWAPVFAAATQLSQTGRGPYPTITQHQQNLIQSIRNQVTQQRNAAKSNATIGSTPLNSILAPYGNRTVIHSKSIIGRRILEDTKLSPEGAIALFLSIPTYPGRNTVQFPGGFQVAPLVEGLIHADLIEKGFSDKEQQARLNDIAIEGGKLKVEYQKEVSLARQQREETQSKGLQLLEDQKKAIGDAARIFAEQHDKHESELEEIRKSFREGMKLRESRRYWADKALWYKKVGRNWFVAFGASAVATAVLLSLFAREIVDFAKAPSTSALPGAEWVLLGVPALIILWLLRFLQRHATLNLGFMNDAAERATMVETYLALTSEGKIEAVERPLVLQALFRPNVMSGEDEASVSIAQHVIDVVSKR